MGTGTAYAMAEYGPKEQILMACFVINPTLSMKLCGRLFGFLAVNVCDPFFSGCRLNNNLLEKVGR